MSWWERRIVPRLVECSCGTPALGSWREETCAGLSGRVLEVGFGSGFNLRHLPGDVTALAAVEPSDLGWEISARRRQDAATEVERVGLDGAQVPLPDASCDSALCTFTLCTVPDPANVLSEMGRILRPDGRLHLLEHGLAPSARVATWQRRLDPVQRRVAGGCHLSRDATALVREAGFAVTEIAQGYLPGPRVARPWGYLTRLTATAPSR